jgi:hypothetical protein
MYKRPWQIDLARAKHDETLKHDSVLASHLPMELQMPFQTKGVGSDKSRKVLDLVTT